MFSSKWMSSFFVALLFVVCKSKLPPTWGKYGEYPCTHKSVKVGGYVSGGSQNAFLVYPTTAIANKTILPFITFAHGMTAGGQETYSAYVNVMQFVCSHGYIIAAPQSCLELYCQGFYQDVETTITSMSTKKGQIDPVLEYADFSKIGVYGHSMGGAATVHVSDYNNLNIICSAPMHPSVNADSNSTESKDVDIPTLWFTGSDDSLTPTAYQGYQQDPTIPKIYAEVAGASHTSAIEMEATYIGEYFDCMIRGDQNACSYFFDNNGPNNICTGGLKMTRCVVNGTNIIPVL